MAKLFKDVVWFEEIASTQDYLKARALSSVSGAIVASVTQTMAYGRRGNQWAAPVGGLYFSFLLKPERLSVNDLSWLPLLLAIACVHELNGRYAIGAQVKWPNDIYVCDKKIGGVLCETQFMGDKLSFIVSGIGINLNIAATDLPDGAIALASMIGARIDIKDFLTRLLGAIEIEYSRYLQDGGRYVKSELAKIDYLADKEITVRLGAEISRGRVVGLDDYGRLILESPGRGELVFSSGDVSIAL